MTLAIERAKAGRKPFWVVEFYLSYCSLTWGVSPCSPAGTTPCYNTRPSCQSPNTFDNNLGTTTKVYRFCTNSAEFPRALDAIPILEAVSITPAELAIGAGLGKRGVATIVLHDGQHNDRGIDPYVAQRTYNALTQGTLLGRLLARNRFFLGRKCVIYKGYLTGGPAGEPVFDYANAERRTYFLEKAEGPSGGKVTFMAKDLLKLADDERAVAPRPAQGRLLAGITAVAGSATLTPTGIGDAVDSYGRAAYPASGKLRINKEVITYTRSGDTLTLTARGQHNTAAAAHAADDAVQPCLEFSGASLHSIASTLLTTYALVPAAYIPSADWQLESDTYNTKLYSALITEPTGVNKLIGELCEQGPAYFTWDDVAAQIIYRALRPASSAADTLTDASHFVKGSVSARSRHDLRMSEIIVNFGQRDPTEPVDNVSNYQVAVYKLGTSAGRDKEGQHRTKVINARWLSATSRTFVEELCDSYLQRYDEPPRELTFRVLPKDSDYLIADLFKASTMRLQGVDGLAELVTFQALSRGGDMRDQFAYKALEERYSADVAVSSRTIHLSAPKYTNFNLRTEHDQLYAAPSAAVTVTCIIDAGVIIGSTTAAAFGFSAGDWPAGSTITLKLRGRFQGKGGDVTGSPTKNGGPAFYTRYPVTIDCSLGTPQIWGGGGAGSAGGGGAGYLHGEGVVEDGTTEEGGRGSPSFPGAGGDPGEPGTGGSPGAAGNAIDGLSFITFIGSADIRGAQVN